LVGRLKAVINFAGMKIFPQEVEEVLNQFPAVAESLVYGEPHAEYGQLPCAQLVLAPGTQALNERELLTFCKKHLSTHKIPKTFRCVEQLPKTASGKIRRY
jgi:long-chain acyl-CoA synthetase